MSNQQFKGTGVALITPFNEDGSIDFPGLETIVNHLIENRTDTILVAGTTGESPTLSNQEKVDLLKKVIEFAGGRARVIFGSGSNNTESSVKASVSWTSNSRRLARNGWIG